MKNNQSTKMTILTKTTILMTLAFLLSVFALDARAATYVVDTTGDNAALNGCTSAAADCSLRGAIAKANGTAVNDTINFAIPSGGAGCAGGVCTITLTGGQLTVNAVSTAGTLLVDNATGASNLLISGNDAATVFFVLANGNLSLNGLTVTRGFSATVGAGILAEGTLTLTNSIISGNNARVYGGGIYSRFGTVTLTNSTLSGNNASDGGGIYNLGGTITLTNSIVSGHTASNFGGGIYNNSGTITLTGSTVSGNAAINGHGGGINNNGTLMLTNSTVSGNTAPTGGGIINNINDQTTLTNSTVSGNIATFGGGIYNSGGTATLTNSTVSGNTAGNGGSGGGIYTAVGALNLTSVTVTNNNSSFGSGVLNDDGAANLRNTIVAKNTGAPDFSGAISTTSTFNLIGDGTGMSGITGAGGGNQVGDSTNPIDPKLGSLADNSGATQTHAFLPGSPAIDKGSAAGTDQRGFTRPVDLATYANAGNAADIGAFEAQTAPLAPTAATVSIGGTVTTMSGRSIMNIRLSLTDSEGNIRTATTDSSGSYRFDNVQVGETYILTATAKHYSFSQPVQILNVNEETDGVDFIANTEKRLKIF